MRCRLAASVTLLLASVCAARAEDPKLVAGRDPGGVAVAVLADGFDYKREDVARILARDGEGEAIAWDAVERDARPFAAAAAGTALALAAAARGGVRVVAVRVAAGDTASLVEGVAFAVATPARIVLVALDADAKDGLGVLKAAAQRFDAVLLVGSVPKLTADAKADGDSLSNLILLDAGDTGHAAAEGVARVLGCGQDAPAGENGAALKRAFLARLDGDTPARCEPQGGAGKDQQR